MKINMMDWLKSNRLYFSLAAFFLVAFLLGVDKASAAAGCCSWHGGVSHCDTSVGKQVCNDGSFSPSCTCAKDSDVKKDETENQKVKKLFDIGWCGAGALFDNQDDAKKSLAEYTEKIKEPLKNDIARQDQEKINYRIALYILLAIIIILIIYLSLDKEQMYGIVTNSKKHLLFRIVILAVPALLIATLIYYFSYYLPKKESADSQHWKALDQSRIEENNKLIDAWLEQQKKFIEAKVSSEEQKILEEKNKTEQQKEEEMQKKETERINKENEERIRQECYDKAQKIYSDKKKDRCKDLLGEYKDCLEDDMETRSSCIFSYGTHFDDRDCDLPYSDKNELEDVLNHEMKKCN